LDALAAIAVAIFAFSGGFDKSISGIIAESGADRGRMGLL
jgi:hypothetical protein